MSGISETKPIGHFGSLRHTNTGISGLSRLPKPLHVTIASSSIAATLRLKPGRQFPFLARHPWVHAHALADLGENLTRGDTVDLIDHDGNWIARGLINPHSRLRIRLYSYDSAIQVNTDLYLSRISSAIARRELIRAAEGVVDPKEIASMAERLVFSESDLLSGLIVDRYADCLGVQFTSGALWESRETILEHLDQCLSPRAIMVRVDEKTAKHEGIAPEQAWYRDRDLTEPVRYRQNGLELTADLHSGQKTGGYLDQRLNQKIAAGYLVGRRVLDMCCYHGGFGLAAAAAGAQSVVGVDTSQSALETAQKLATHNHIENIRFEQGDCFDWLKEASESGRFRTDSGQANSDPTDRGFDAIVLDPPRFAGSRHQVDSAIRAYRRLNSHALDLLPPGGLLITCSCSGRVSRSDFLNMLLDLGRRRQRDLVMLENRGPSPDHPVAISCPESDYLKCVILCVQ